MTTIRTLGPGDLATMRALLGVFAAAFEDPETYAARKPGDAWLARVLAAPHVIVLAAVEAAGSEGEGTATQTVVGGLCAYELMKFEQERSEIYIYDLAVAESHRRGGIATALIRRLQAIAAERGAWVIFVQADLGDDPAIALYTGLGTREDVLHFDIHPRAG